MITIRLLVILLANFLLRALAARLDGIDLPPAPSYELTPSTCAAPDDYTACISDANNQNQNCVTNSGVSPTNVLECAYITAYLKMACAIKTCWNQVYSCQYQRYAYILGLSSPVNASSFSFPYFPPPENAPHSCSCNIGKLFEAQAPNDHDPQVCNYHTSDFTYDFECGCCTESLIYTSIFKICPTTNPDLIGLQNYSAFVQSNGGLPFDQCAPHLAGVNCVQQFGFPPIAGSEDYLTAFPSSSGTQTTYETGAPITTPISPTIVYTALNGVQYTLIASPAQMSFAPTGSASVGAGSGSSGSGSNESSSPQATSGSGGGGGGGDGGTGGTQNVAGRLNARDDMVLMLWCMIAMISAAIILS